MKLKVAIASFAVASVVVAAFAFTTKRTITTQYLDESKVASVVIGSLQSDVANAANWSTSLGYSFANGTKLAAATFDQELSTDGSGDGLLSKSEATQAIYDYYVNNGNTLPADGQTISVSVNGTSGNSPVNITIRRKN